MNTTTPTQITEQIKKLCKKIVSHNDFVWVDVIPESWCLMDECFQNINKKMINDNGSIQYGWTIWEWKNVLVEAEFHAVWKTINNELVDITPKLNNENNILFLIDDSRSFNGSRTDNIRLPLSNDRVVLDFIKLSKKLFNLFESGSHKENPLVSTFNKNDALQLSVSITELEKMINAGEDEDSKCYCGSAKKYKNCHSKMFV